MGTISRANVNRLTLRRVAAALAGATVLFPLVVALPVDAIPGEVIVGVSSPGDFMNVNNSGTYPANFTIPIDVTVQNAGYRSFRVTISFLYQVYNGTSNEVAEGWLVVGVPSLSFDIPAQASVGRTFPVNGSVSENGSAMNETLFEAVYNTQTSAPLLTGGVGTVSVLLFLADAPQGGQPPGPSGGGGVFGAGPAIPAAVAAAVGIGGLLAAVLLLRRAGKPVPGRALVRRFSDRTRQFALRRKGATKP